MNDGNGGYKLSEEGRANLKKAAQRRKGKTPWNKGKKYSPEEKLKRCGK